VRDPEPFSDRLRVGVGALEGESGVAGHDEHAGVAAERAHHLLGQRVAQVPGRLGTLILEREHGHGARVQ
jgi:hypothetical protein